MSAQDEMLFAKYPQTYIRKVNQDTCERSMQCTKIYSCSQMINKPRTCSQMIKKPKGSLKEYQAL